jgi:aspartate kinase
MATLVKKFGGSSVASPEKMHGIVERILRERKPGDRIVVVVSAMGDTTDDLLSLAKKVNPEMPKREMDMLLATGEQMSIALTSFSLYGARGSLQYPLPDLRQVLRLMINTPKLQLKM